MPNKITLTLTTLVIALTASLPTLAADEYNVSTGITTAGVPLGLHGVDAVALTTLGAVAEGDAAFTVVHDGNAYYFASQAAADRFEKKPGAFLPQYGGFCAYAVALGKKFDGDPMFADVVDGKLYLFVNAAIFEKYLQDRDNILRKAEKTWPKIRREPVGSL